MKGLKKGHLSALFWVKFFAELSSTRELKPTTATQAKQELQDKNIQITTNLVPRDRSQKNKKKPNTSSPGEDENTHLPRIGEKPKNGTGAGAHLALLGSIGEEVVAETRRGHLLTRLAVAGTSQSLTSWEGRTREIRSLFMGSGFGGLLCHRRS